MNYRYWYNMMYLELWNILCLMEFNEWTAKLFVKLHVKQTRIEVKIVQ
jgi:hypothetical protein